MTDHFKSGKHAKKMLEKMMKLHLPGASNSGSNLVACMAFLLFFKVYKTNHIFNE